MRKLLILLALTIAASANARQRSAEEMLNVARRILPIEARGNNAGTLMQLYGNDALRVYGQQGTGFAIVACDDRFEPLVGYSDADFQLEAGSPLAWYLAAAGEALTASAMPARTPIAPSAEFAPQVEPLLATTWNQSKPYNQLCPKDTRGNGYPTGCVATACSQILNYYKYPVQGRGNKQYSFKPAEGEGRLLSADFGQTTYDWDNMLNDYEKQSYSDAQANAVATLMLHCGVAVEMNYTPTGSGAYTSEARNGLVDFFLYNENMGVYIREYYSEEEWMHMVYSEISLQRPIYYAGVDEKGGGGHAFVLDGYDHTGLVHVNWGWGEKGANGYFDIGLLNSNNGTFSKGQEMLRGLVLPTEHVDYETHIVSDYAMTAKKAGTLVTVTVGSTLWNMSGSTWSGQIGIILQGAETSVLSSTAVNKVPNRKNVLNYTENNLSSIVTLPKDLADGTYRLFVGVKDDKTANWQLVRRKEGLANSYMVTISGGKLTDVTAVTDDSWPRTTTAIQAVKAPTDTAGKCYDLQGRHMKQPAKGIYIRNGRKTIKAGN